ncbi:TPA: hypothetical protein ACPYPK_001038 [Legionella pneumophila]|uniref:hypothetical protein n=1 Tax=Legionella pneumophila TaxID=446 RepID=UPI000875B850|nr:hypothetical protein [Legionella pneumophila]AOW57836.1 hypothetical protein BE843_05955 [Legionella pneumophila subsp. pneumophila]AOW61980.1 hypothetical protein BE844_12815 [Legionella pneumophila subsp. pneumophila]AOW67378.1 hypothetical protein BE846_10580 [Legionella pneumophila subsp. pneumophila]HAT2038724.1 hypothetical protein [Legionella pneumophila]HCW6766651.1 hypothetical protein [Legionella pneumophila]
MREQKQSKKDKLDAKISFAQDRYKFYTTEASKIARQVAFAEGAIFWALYILMQNGPKSLIITFYSILLLFFIFDLIQYVYGAIRFEYEEDAIKKVRASNKKIKGINYKIGDEIGNSIKTYYLIKLFFLCLATIILIIMFVTFINSNLPAYKCNPGL